LRIARICSNVNGRACVHGRRSRHLKLGNALIALVCRVRACLTAAAQAAKHEQARGASARAWAFLSLSSELSRWE
jgi:hypothetical protein